MNHDQRLAEIATINTVLRTLADRGDEGSVKTRDRLHARILELLSPPAPEPDPVDLLVDLGDGVVCHPAAVSRVVDLDFYERYDLRSGPPGRELLSRVTFATGSDCLLRITAEEAGRRLRAARKPRS